MMKNLDENVLAQFIVPLVEKDLGAKGGSNVPITVVGVSADTAFHAAFAVRYLVGGFTVGEGMG